MEWSAGYITDLDYTYGYYRELSPRLIDFALLLSGFEPPNTAQSRYLELGYGQGISANVHAAAVPGVFYGTDFNPAHAANAQNLARISHADAHFFDEGFAEFAKRDDLPEFDYIALHGIWSWVSDVNRAAIVDIIHKRLKVGGAVYVSYNALPGWASGMPLRHLLSLHADTAGGEAQSRIEKIDQAIKFGKQLEEAKAAFFTGNPQATSKLKQIAEQDRNYVAHEYFNRHWSPTYFSEVQQQLSEAKLSFACSVSTIDAYDEINFTTDQRKILDGYSNPLFKESVRDFIRNQKFRRDIFVKGARRLKPIEQLEKLKEISILPLIGGEEFDYTLPTARGKIALRKELFDPLIELLGADGSCPKKIGTIVEALSTRGIQSATAIQAAALLVGSNRAGPVQPDVETEKSTAQCRRLNAHLLERSRLGGYSQCLASPVLGAGLSVGRFEQLFLRARSQGLKEPEQWAHDAWRHLKAQGQAVVKDGKALNGDAENIPELASRAAEFAQTRLPLLKTMLIVE